MLRGNEWRFEYSRSSPGSSMLSSDRCGFVRFLVIGMMMFGLGGLGRSAWADDPTVYRIRNLWLADQVRADGGGKVVYQARGKDGDRDANSRWTMEDVR